jgi:hypothetical protein
MSRRYWLPIIAVVGLTLAAASQAQTVKQGSRAASGGQATQQQVAQRPPPEAANAATNKLIERAAKALEAANRDPYAAQEAQDSKANLDIQRDMAKSAETMAKIGALEAFITFVGVILVGWTLFHTRRAAEAARAAVNEAQAATAIAKDNLVLARDHGQQDLRAWVSIDLELVKVLRTAENAHFTVKLSLKNIGKTPALNVGVTTNIWTSNSITVGRRPEPVPDKFPHMMPPLLPGEDTDQRFGLRISSEDVAAAIEASRKEQCTVMVTIDAIVHYQTIFDEPGTPRHMTSVRYHAHPTNYDPRNMEQSRTWLDNGLRDLTQVLFVRDRDAPTLMH